MSDKPKATRTFLPADLPTGWSWTISADDGVGDESLVVSYVVADDEWECQTAFGRNVTKTRFSNLRDALLFGVDRVRKATAIREKYEEASRAYAEFVRPVEDETAGFAAARDAWEFRGVRAVTDTDLPELAEQAAALE